MVSNSWRFWVEVCCAGGQLELGCSGFGVFLYLLACFLGFLIIQFTETVFSAIKEPMKVESLNPLVTDLVS